MPRTAALVTHYNRPHLLADAAMSLASQTRLLDAIIVLDDASDQSPADSLRLIPGLVSYRSDRNVGPYALIEWAIRHIEADWYLIQDSDDISLPTRLEHVLHAVANSGADIVGTSIRNVNTDTGKVLIKSFEEDAVAAHFDGRMWINAFGATIISRQIWARVGGFATGLRMSGDVEFMSRACHVGKLINTTSVELIRRIQPDSLTRRPDTGNQSPARKALREQLVAAAQRRIADRLAGRPVDLRPFCTAPEPVMTRVI